MTEKDGRQAEYLANRLIKRQAHLGKWARRQGLEAYRLYDNDIPEVPLAIDRYGDAIIMALYERPYEKPEEAEAQWLELMARSAAQALGLLPENVFVKRRGRQRGNEQYGVLGRQSVERVVAEGPARYKVNLSDYLDSGLFLDHRPLRSWLSSQSAGLRVLNLFCYTGSLSVAAALGAAAHVVSLDLSQVYLDWARDNAALNSLDMGRLEFRREDVLEYLGKAGAKGERFDTIILDPPTFSNSKRMRADLDVQRDHGRLINDALGLLARGGRLYFSTNSRHFRFQPPPGVDWVDRSAASVPPDFRDAKIHRLWELRA